MELSVPAESTFRFSLACFAVEAPVPPSKIEISAIPVIDPPLMRTEFMFCVDIVPRPKEVLAATPSSATNFVPSPTIIDPSVGLIADIVERLLFNACFPSI